MSKILFTSNKNQTGKETFVWKQKRVILFLRTNPSAFLSSVFAVDYSHYSRTGCSLYACVYFMSLAIHHVYVHASCVFRISVVSVFANDSLSQFYSSLWVTASSFNSVITFFLLFPQSVLFSFAWNVLLLFYRCSRHNTLPLHSTSYEADINCNEL